MQKKDIDKYFTDNYEDLVEYAKRMYITQSKYKESPHALVSGAYEYLLSHLGNLESELDIKNFTSTFIYHNTRWNNGWTEYRKKYQRVKTYSYETGVHDFEEDKVYSQEEYDTQIKAILDTYKNYTSLEDKAVWEIYFEKGCNTVIKFAEYIGMSRMPAYNYIKKLREDINKTYNQIVYDYAK